MRIDSNEQQTGRHYREETTPLEAQCSRYALVSDACPRLTSRRTSPLEDSSRYRDMTSRIVTRRAHRGGESRAIQLSVESPDVFRVSACRSIRPHVPPRDLQSAWTRLVVPASEYRTRRTLARRRVQDGARSPQIHGFGLQNSRAVKTSHRVCDRGARKTLRGSACIHTDCRSAVQRVAIQGVVAVTM